MTETGVKMRSPRMIFSKETFEEEAILEELTFPYDYGPWRDSELNEFSVPSTRGDADGNGELELTDAIRFLNRQFVGCTVPSCLDAADANDSGEVDIADAITT